MHGREDSKGKPGSARCQVTPRLLNSRILVREPKILKSDPGNEPGAAFEECCACSRRAARACTPHPSRIRRMLAWHSATARVATTNASVTTGDGSRGTDGALCTIHRLQDRHRGCQRRWRRHRRCIRRLRASIRGMHAVHSPNAPLASGHPCRAIRECPRDELFADIAGGRMADRRRLLRKSDSLKPAGGAVVSVT
jgi:hypothetical protein